MADALTHEFTYAPLAPDFHDTIWDVYRRLRDEHPCWYDADRDQ